MNTSGSWGFLLLTICLNTGANLFLKLSNSVPGMFRLYTVGSSLFCYGLAFICYYYALRTLPVSVAYPLITGGAMVMILICGMFTLGESVTASKVFGTMLILFGGMLLLRQG